MQRECPIVSYDVVGRSGEISEKAAAECFKKAVKETKEL